MIFPTSPRSSMDSEIAQQNKKMLDQSDQFIPTSVFCRFPPQPSFQQIEHQKLQQINQTPSFKTHPSVQNKTKTDFVIKWSTPKIYQKIKLGDLYSTIPEKIQANLQNRQINHEANPKNSLQKQAVRPKNHRDKNRYKIMDQLAITFYDLKFLQQSYMNLKLFIFECRKKSGNTRKSYIDAPVPHILFVAIIIFCYKRQRKLQNDNDLNIKCSQEFLKVLGLCKGIYQGYQKKLLDLWQNFKKIINAQQFDDIVIPTRQMLRIVRVQNYEQNLKKENCIYSVLGMKKLIYQFLKPAAQILRIEQVQFKMLQILYEQTKDKQINRKALTEKLVIQDMKEDD